MNTTSTVPPVSLVIQKDEVERKIAILIEQRNELNRQMTSSRSAFIDVVRNKKRKFEEMKATDYMNFQSSEEMKIEVHLLKKFALINLF